ncbi:Uncharacterized protein SCF082_LOCUS20831 [Durusdinium trenchii]|uniref:Uncharacterized protein n=1 Tax=Durusdinium trenchii TaxID=1381693 RepID=A0ABP0L6I1_9DINO
MTPVAAMARQGRSSSPRSGHGIACSLLLLGALQGVPFVGRAPFHESLAAQGTLLRAADQEVEALLAQAKALREEAERDEAAIRAAREAEEAEAAAQAAEAAAAAQDLAALQAAAQRATELAEAATDPVAQARAAVKAAKAKLDIAKLEAAGAGSSGSISFFVKAAPSAPPSAGANPSGRLEDVKLNFSGTVMTQAEWEDLSEKFKDMNLIEQFQTNSKVGPQGRRKLKALREGVAGRSFILPGERVRLLKEEQAFRNAFKRFPAQTLNGYTAEKWAKRGEECIIEKVFNDKTITCVFADASRLDFPWEIVDGFVDD